MDESDPQRIPSELEVVELSGARPKWRLRLEPEAMVLTPESGEPATRLSRADARVQVEVHDGILVKRTIVVPKPKRRLYQLPQEAFDKFRTWFGPPTEGQLKAALKKRLGWSITIGILIALTSAPLPGDPLSGIEPVPLDLVSLALGSSLVVVGIVSKLFPHRRFFLVDSVWFLALAVETAVDIAQGSNPAWVLLILAYLMIISAGFREFRHFAPLDAEAESENEAPE